MGSTGYSNRRGTRFDRGTPSGPGRGVTGGTHRFIRPNGNPGEWYGTGGAESCTGLLVIMPDGTIGVFHFYAGDDVFGTLGQYNFPPGSVFVMFGGNQDASSIQTLNDVRLYLDIIRNSIPYWNDGNQAYAFPLAQGAWYCPALGTFIWLYERDKEFLPQNN